MSARYAGGTVRGRGRPANEDRLLGEPSLGLFAVADGMGGSACGGAAAARVVAALPAVVRDAGPGAIDARVARAVVAGLDRMSGRIRDGAPAGRTAGSTVVVGLVRGGRLLVAHLGDSRAYLLRHGTLAPLTRDHNVATELVLAGRLAADEARAHRGRALLTRFVGMGGAARADVVVRDLHAGDRVGLCSDGLLDALSEPELATVLTTPGPPARAVERAMAAVRAAGAPDDASLVVVEVDGR